jgi:hypothetical protein
VDLDALQIRVALSLPDIGPQEPKEVLLLGDQMAAAVQLVLPPGAGLQYRYQTLAFRATDGTIATSEWQDRTGSPLVIQTRNL